MERKAGKVVSVKEKSRAAEPRWGSEVDWHSEPWQQGSDCMRDQRPWRKCGFNSCGKWEPWRVLSEGGT